MTVCYAYDTAWPPPLDWDLDYPCSQCQHYYWEHSHQLATFTDGTARRIIIPKWEAMDVYDFYHATREPAPDTRPRYQMMMDRQPGVIAWVNVRMNQEMDRQADTLLRDIAILYATGPKHDLPKPEVIHPATQAEIDVYGIPEEPAEITTWSDMMARQRRWLMPDGTTHIESAHYPENHQP